MITPRRTTLTSVAGLRALHRAIADTCASADVGRVRATAVLVPTRSAAAQLRRTLEHLWLFEPPASPGPGCVVFPELLTRGDWYRRMLERAGGGCRLLSDIEREVLLGAAARDAIEAGCAPPFRMRAGLVAQMLALYDALRRQQKTVADFERLVTEDLEPRAEFDRGAERLLRQTRFLAATFRAFEKRVEAAGALDEHRLRERLLEPSAAAFRHVVITMGDRVSEPSSGLYPADFDLLSRLPHLESIDIVNTRAALLAGLGERLRELLPGIEERTAGDAEASPSHLTADALPPHRQARACPLHLKPAGGLSYFVSRDREEELRDIARRIKTDLRASGEEALPRVAVVFRRPLPYVYLGRTVFDSAGIEHQAADALPLAAEPFAAAIDLIFSAVAGRFARGPLLQLLRSPHFLFSHDGRELPAGELGMLDRTLAAAGYLGDVERLHAFAEQGVGSAAPAARAAARAAAALAPLSHGAPLSSHLDTLLSFVRQHERLRPDDEGASSRHLRARAAVLRILEDLRAAALRYDDPNTTLADLAPSIRRWLESQTFTPTQGAGGVELVDASSARYGEFEHVHLAGLVAGDWPEASARNIFYPSFLLARLGWPPESARLAAERAVFADLLRLPRDRVSVSSFTLEDDSIVEPSPLLEELERTGLEAVAGEARAPTRIFADEALTGGACQPGYASAIGWAELRAGRSPASEPQFHGFTSAAGVSKAYTVTGIDRYLECPFKYFARAVLDLPEETPDEQGMSPKDRGRFVHEVFRAFFAEWQARGGAGIGVEQLEQARALFAEVTEDKLSMVPASEAPLERLRLIGSVAAPGLGDIVLAAEAVRPTPLVERLLEFSFDGEFALAAGGAERTLRLRGKADRVDVLADGSFRVIDYKIGRSPDDSIQLPVYALCLQQHLARQGRKVEMGEALYIAFGDRARPVESVMDEGPKRADVLEAAQQRVLAAVGGIERGEFPPRPAAPRLCGTCAYAAVCRKDLVVAD